MRNYCARVIITADFYLVCAFSILILPVKWFFSVCIAAAVHELSHVLVLELYGARIHSITLGGSGAVIKTGALSCGAEIISALAGPIGGFLLIFFARIVPSIAFCAVIHSLFNLLPLYPLDGGRALYAVLKACFGHKTAAHISYIVRWLVLILLFLLSLLCCDSEIGVAPMVISGFAIIKYSCKAGRKIVI